jgi:hypothetical protein
MKVEPTLDRCKPEEDVIVAECAGCGGEIYQGEVVYRFNGELIHQEWACIDRYLDPEVVIAGEGDYCGEDS